MSDLADFDPEAILEPLRRQMSVTVGLTCIAI
jgi:hypothetical protein